MNAKNIFRNIMGLAMSALLLIPAAFVSCSDDDTGGRQPLLPAGEYRRIEQAGDRLLRPGFRQAEAIIGDATLD